MDDAETEQTGRIYRGDGKGVTEVDLAPVCITNGPCFSPDGETLYHVDTLGGIIHASQIGPQGAVIETRIFARIDPADGYPVGIIADAAGNVWVGLWNGWCTRQYAPDGSILTQVRMPASTSRRSR
jgi:D-xylonolactonase